MADYNPDISNGTCYYANGEEAPSRYIPCGNEALGHKPCCESLDMCLSSNACYNGQYGVTYLAGCTDPDYLDSKCPDKGDFADQTWAGLVYCNGTSNEWVACEDSGSTVSSPAPCWCPFTSRTVAFTDASRLNDIMSLPASLGASVSWKDVSAYQSEHSLTSTSSASDSSHSQVTTSLAPASTSTFVSKTATFTSFAIPNPTEIVSPSAASTVAISGSELSTGAMIGIALGSSGGMAVILLLAWLAFRCMRRRDSGLHPEPPMVGLNRPQSEVVQTDFEMRSPPWSSQKSELAADENTGASPSYGYQDDRRPQSVEVEGGPARISPARPTHGGGYKLPGLDGTFYEMPG
ncbi:uncharacterized protein Z518_11126 [Rhinocladiella mackenziei CBS 650.93]|uniref:Uncharacterized protein n=1 Tax=Rhinocladiella mackenziei CBS 650.93 TaxID=1442369 RepID=A0A0D2I1U5_9EURO|nr:uncharacterized protein Z518_11126 [Rhinocladiella mackenziei CBS 650.93]KIW99713.1 hypothetical protein Z518_11126 [Rhinocladiella mackenziei CBS 650.93]